MVKEDDVDETSKKFFTLNKGTSIAVSNSILKPERYKYGTKVSNKIVEAYPMLGEEEEMMY